MKIISIRENREYADRAIQYVYSKWGNVNNYLCYHDCIDHSIDVKSSLPRWYLMLDDNDNIIGCGGLLSNDFISRMDLSPWIASLYIEEEERGKALGSKLIEHIKMDAKNAGFDTVYLATDHVGYYEKYGFEHIGMGYHPWGDSSRVYKSEI